MSLLWNVLLLMSFVMIEEATSDELISHHNDAIDGLTVIAKTSVTVNEPLSFTVRITSGSNVDIDITDGIKPVCTMMHWGLHKHNKVFQIKAMYFDVVGAHELLVRASNNINSKSTNVTIVVSGSSPTEEPRSSIISTQRDTTIKYEITSERQMVTKHNITSHYKVKTNHSPKNPTWTFVTENSYVALFQKTAVTLPVRDYQFSCFEDNNILPPDHKTPQMALRSYSSLPTNIKTRPKFRSQCHCLSNLTYHLNLLDWGSGNLLQLPRGVIQNGRIVIQKYLLNPGLYKLSLTLVLPCEFSHDFMYIRLEEKPPFAFIVGGSRRNVQADTPVLIDVLVNSNTNRENTSLTFKGQCEKTASKESHKCDIFNIENYLSITKKVPCSPTQFTIKANTGIMVLNVTSADVWKSFVITVNVTARSAYAIFTQLISVSDILPSNIHISCLRNCLGSTELGIKISSRITLKLRMECNHSCSTNFSVGLREIHTEKNGITSHEVESTCYDLKLKIGHQAIVVALGTSRLNTSKRYTVYLSSYFRQHISLHVHNAAVDFVINQAPYGGNCTVTPTSGYAMKQIFTINCPNWTDEGEHAFRNRSRDIKSPVPLHYKYHFSSCNDNSTITCSSLLLYQGWEHSSPGVYLPLGDAHRNYSASIIIQIVDRYGDKAEVRLEVFVHPEVLMIPKDKDDVMAVKTLFHSFKDQYISADLEGDHSAVFKIARFTSSFYQTENLTMLNVREVTEVEILSGRVNPQYIDQSDNSPVVREIKTMNKELSDVLVSSISSQRKETNNLSDTDLDNIFTTMKSCVSNPLLLNEGTVSNVLNGSDILIDHVLMSLTNQNGSDINRRVDSITEDTLNVMDTISSKYFPEEIPKDIKDDSFLNFLHGLKSQVDMGNQHIDTDEILTNHEERIALLYRHLKRKDENFKIVRNTYRFQCLSVEKAEDTVPKMLSLFRKVQDFHLERLDIGASTNFSGDTVVVKVEKPAMKDLFRQGREIGGALINFKDEEYENDTHTSDHANISLLSFRKSPFLYSKDADKVRSMVLSLTLGDRMNFSHDIHFPNTKIEGAQHRQIHIDPNHVNDIHYFSHYVENDGDSTVIHLNSIVCMADRCDVVLYMRKQDHPTEDLYDYTDTKSLHDKPTVNFIIPAENTKSGRSFIGIQVRSHYQNNTLTREKRSLQIALSLHRKANDTSRPNQMNLTLSVATTACQMWNDRHNTWDASVCKVLPVSTVNFTVCRCPKSSGGIYATSFLPNAIDFDTVFSKFRADNAYVYGTLIAIFCIYFFFAVWLRRQDEKDIEKWTVKFLCDTDTEDKYFYLVSVHTGLRRNAGTKSAAYVIAAGEDGDSGIRILSDGVNWEFPTGSVRRFFMGTQRPLGELSYLRVWHDNSGCGSTQSWYLSKITVDDLQALKRFVFKCDDWLAFDMSDETVERTLPVCGTDEHSDFKSRFSEHTTNNLTDDHLWMSVFLRPEQSNFSRVQRSSCILALLLLTMISNAIFYKEEITPIGGQIQIGSVRFTLHDLYISFIGTLITTPPIIIIAAIFRKAKEYPFKKNGKQQDLTLNDYIYVLHNQRVNRYVCLQKLAFSVAWVILCLAVLAPAFFLILYSMEWGKSKSTQWLISFGLSFLHSVFIVDPIKVVAISTLFAVWFKTHHSGICPYVDTGKLRDASNKFKTCGSRALNSFRMGVLSKTQQSLKEDLERHRLRRKQERQAEDILIQLIVYGIFVFVIYSISYINRDARSFALKDNIDNYLVKSTNSSYGFTEISDYKDFIRWFTDTFIPNYYPQYDCKGNKVETPFWFADCANIRIGTPRLRQVRMRNVTCKVTKFYHGYPCIQEYSEAKEEHRQFSPGWIPFDRALCFPPDSGSEPQCNAWRHVSGLELKGIPISGDYNTYSGGGYVISLPRTRTDVKSLLEDLIKYRWIDRQTRALFLEFTLYNPNVNLFTYLIFLTEMTELGGAFQWTDIRVIRPYQNIGDTGIYATICYIIYLIALVYETVKCGVKLQSLKLRFFLKTWNVIDFLSIILGYIALALFIVRMVYAKNVMTLFYHQLETKLQFINFQYIVVWDFAFNCIVGILLFVSTICILRILRYNKRLTQIIDVITNAKEDILGFGFIFGIAFLLFVVCGYLLFGANVAQYKSVFTSLGSLTNALIGKNRLDVMIRTSPSIAQLYYFLYVFCVVFTLLTIFSVILNNSIRQVRENFSRESETFGVFDILLSSIFNILGIHRQTKQPSSNLSKGSAFRNESGRTLDSTSIVTLIRDIFTLHTDNDTRKSSTGDRTIREDDLVIDRYSFASVSTPRKRNSFIKNSGTIFARRCNTHEKIQTENTSFLSRIQTLRNIQVVVDEDAG